MMDGLRCAESPCAYKIAILHTVVPYDRSDAVKERCMAVRQVRQVRHDRQTQYVTASKTMVHCAADAAEGSMVGRQGQRMRTHFERMPTYTRCARSRCNAGRSGVPIRLHKQIRGLCSSLDRFCRRSAGKLPLAHD